MATKNIVPRANNEGGIGTSAKRWANGYFTDINASGDLSVAGTITGDLTGNVTGDVTGDLTGNVTGDVTGDLTGNVTGNVTGDVTGNADTATNSTNATNDGNGNQIDTTYLPLAGGTMTGAIKGNPVTLTADDGNNEVSLIGKADFGLMWNNVPISLPDGTYDLEFYGFGDITSNATALDITFPYICRNKDIYFNSLSAILRSYKGYLSPGGSGGGDILTGSTQGTWYGKNSSYPCEFRLVRSGGWGTNGENNTVVVGEFSANVTVTTVV